MSRLSNIKHFYEKYERHIGSATLLIGFVFDNLTLRGATITSQTRVFLTYLILGGLTILFLHYLENRQVRKDSFVSVHFWVFLLMQFSIGSLFSLFFVFYSRGVSFATSWPFLLLLFANLIGNELFKEHYVRLSVQIPLYFIGIFSFFIYFLPVLFHQMNAQIFLWSGALSLLTVFVFMRILEVISRKRVSEYRVGIAIGVVTVYVLINIFYFTNLIPPVPLVMKEGGVYHNFSVDSSGDYEVQAEESPWQDIFNAFPVYHRVGNEPIYAVTAVYAPAALRTDVIHNWQYFDSQKKEWISASKVEVPISGGREGGYRFYSFKNNLAEGRWRVDVETLQGQVIGRIRFDVVNSTSTPQLNTVVF